MPTEAETSLAGSCCSIIVVYEAVIDNHSALAGSASASGRKLSGWLDERHMRGRKLSDDDDDDDYHHDHHHGDHHWWWWIGR